MPGDGPAGLATDSRFASHAARGANHKELAALINTWTETLQADAAMRLLDAHAVPAGRILTAPDMLADPHFQARQMVLRRRPTQDWDIPMAGVVPNFSDTSGTVRECGPALGQHTREVLTGLAGLDADTVDKLNMLRIVRDPSCVQRSPAP